MIGNTMKAQTWPSAQSPWKTAVAIERAGLTEVLDTGIETMWTSVKPTPAAIGPKPLGTPDSSVVPRTMSTKTAVMTISMIATDRRSKPPGECTPYPFDANPASCAVLKYPSVPLRVRARRPAPTMPPTTWAMMYGAALAGSSFLRGDHADRDGRVDVAAGDPADEIGHGHQAEPEGERDAEDADDGTGQTGCRRAGQPVRRKDRGARSPDDEHRRADALGEHHACGLVHVGSDRSMVWSVSWVMSSPSQHAPPAVVVSPRRYVTTSTGSGTLLLGTFWR